MANKKPNGKEGVAEIVDLSPADQLRLQVARDEYEASKAQTAQLLRDLWALETELKGIKGVL